MELVMAISIRETNNCKAIEMVGEQCVTEKDQVLNFRFKFTFEADGSMSGFSKLGTGDNHIFTRNIQIDKSGHVNSVTKFGPRVKGASVFALSAKSASKNSAVVIGSIDDEPILPMAFMNKLPGKTCFKCCDDVIHSPLMTINNKEVGPVVIDSEMLPAISALSKIIKVDLFTAANGAGSIFAPPGIWPGKGYWCIAACTAGALACITGTVGAATLLCIAAQIACEAACLD